MTDMMTIPRDVFDRLVADSEMLADITAFNKAKAELAAGTDELIPSEFAHRIIGGESPLRVYREFRGLTQVALAAASGVNRVQIAEIEARRKTGSSLMRCRRTGRPWPQPSCPAASPASFATRRRRPVCVRAPPSPAARRR